MNVFIILIFSIGYIPRKKIIGSKGVNIFKALDLCF